MPFKKDLGGFSTISWRAILGNVTGGGRKEKKLYTQGYSTHNFLKRLKNSKYRAMFESVLHKL